MSWTSRQSEHDAVELSDDDDDDDDNDDDNDDYIIFSCITFQSYFPISPLFLRMHILPSLSDPHIFLFTF